MAKTNKVVTDISGKEVTHYGCATIQDACELGGVQAPSNSNKLITIEDVLDKHPYNVGLIDNLNVEYSENGQAVAYDDLRVQDWIELPMGNESQKVGVLRLNASMGVSMLTGGTSDNGYLIDSNSITQVRQCIIDTDNSSLIPGYIRLQLSDISSNYISDTKKGYEIVLQNFLSNLYDESSLEIKSITLKDNVNSTDATSGSDYSTNPDASEFNISNSQKRIVVENGQQKICGMIKPQATDSKYTQYTNFDTNTHQTLSLMLISTESNSITLDSSDMLYSTIEVEFRYLTNDEEIGAVPAISKLSIDLWFKNNLTYLVPEFVELEKDSEELPEVEDNESGEPVTIDPNRTILYTTSDGNTIEHYTDYAAFVFAGGVAVENAGYGILANGKSCGYIQYVETPTTIGNSNLFQGNQQVTTVTLPDGIQTIIGHAFKDCSNLQSIKIPITVTDIGEQAFFRSGLRTLTLMSDWNDLTSSINLQNLCFSQCKNLTKLSIIGSVIVKEQAFAYCASLKEVIFPLGKGQIFPLGNYCFANCSSLETDLLQYTNGQGCYIGVCAFFGCSSLKKITLNGFANWFPFSGAVDGEDWAAWILSIIPALGLPLIFNNDIADSHTFDGCTALKTIIINDYVDQSGNTYYGLAHAGFRQRTFIGCTNVEKIYCNSKHPPYLGAYNINKKRAINPKTCHLYIPSNRTSAYNNAAQWGDFALDHIHELTPEKFENIQ